MGCFPLENLKQDSCFVLVWWRIFSLNSLWEKVKRVRKTKAEFKQVAKESFWFDVFSCTSKNCPWVRPRKPSVTSRTENKMTARRDSCFSSHFCHETKRWVQHATNNGYHLSQSAGTRPHPACGVLIKNKNRYNLEKLLELLQKTKRFFDSPTKM